MATATAALTGAEKRKQTIAAKKRRAERVAEVSVRAGFQPGGTPSIIVAVLAEANRPLTATRIQDEVVKRGGAGASVRTMLPSLVKRHGSPIARIEPGVYALNVTLD
jgi:hypothetical protein